MAKKVFVGMSGGVDSSVSALLLKEQGFDVTGVYMKNWSEDLPGMKCPWAEDLADAKRVAVKLGIDFEVWDFEAEYRERVVEYMLSEFKRGRTPNPDVMCNQEIKFKLFFEKAMERGADFIATGHYAKVADGYVGVGTPFASRTKVLLPSASRHASSRPSLRGSSLTCAPLGAKCLEPDGTKTHISTKNPGTIAAPALLRARDENKDQTYFLYRISDEALRHTIFPIGGMLKPEVKKLAEAKGLHNAYKKESMGVCFVGEVGMKEFLQHYIPMQPGEIREMETGKVLGAHEGAVFYTIGQRHGLYLNGNKGEINDGMPYYVVKKDLPNNLVFVSKNLNDEHIWTTEIKLENIFLRGSDGKEARMKLPENILVRLRHRAELIPAKLDSDTLVFEKAVKRPAAGQSAVFYDGTVCLGGGIIAE